MKIYDVTLTITPDLVTWPGDPTIKLERISKIEDGANANVSRMDMGVHTGTHLDAPVHFLAGEKGVETLALDVLIGPAQVVALADEVQMITAGVLDAAGIAEGTERLLLKTHNSAFWSQDRTKFHTDFAGITADGADYIVQRGIRLVGLDYLSIAPYKMSRPTHERLLKAGVIPVEGLDLRDVNPGFYQLICLPLKLAGSDGSPVRAVLVEG